MYIPFWIIVAVMIGWAYFYYSKKSKSGSQPAEILKQNFSYKLEIYVEPRWYEIYKKMSTPSDENTWEKEISEKVKDFEKSEDKSRSLWGRRYIFTEYYDSATGLITRFQRILCWNGEQKFYPVDEFGDRGYVFDADSSLKAKIDESEEVQARREKLNIQIGENFIRNEIFDKYIGGERLESDYEEKNYIFKFPLYETFNFLLTLGTRFHQVEQNVILKWPEYIEKKFEKMGIEYETVFDIEPHVFDIEKYDKELFEKLGKPKMSISNKDSQFLSTYLRSKENGTHYRVDLTIFRPGENDRIGEFPPRST